MSDSEKPGTSNGSSDNAAKRSERMKKLRDLHLKRNEARKKNHEEVVEEDRRNKLPQNWEAKMKRVEWEEGEDKKKKVAEAEGEDYDRVKLLEVSAVDAEKWDRKKKKKNPDQGFSDYAAASYRQYQRLTKQMKPDQDEYKRTKDKMGEEVFYPTVDTLGVVTHKDSQEGIDRMVNDLEKQIDKRGKYSRRRAHDEDDDIDYINERNAKFNKKLERFYGKYTTDIKQNLERGTAV